MPKTFPTLEAGETMTYAQVDESGEPEEVGNAATMSLLRERAAEGSELQHLLEHGWSQEPQALATEIGQTLDTTDLDAETREALSRVRDAARQGQTVVTLTQGAG